jgi:hypothetical protein
VICPFAGLYGVPVDPVSCGSVTTDFEVFTELLVADRAPLGKQRFDLLEHERVSLDCGRVMGFLQPDTAPDPFGFERRRQPTEPLPQLVDLDLQALVDGRSRRAALAGGGEVVRVWDDSTVPNTFTKVFATTYAICTERFDTGRDAATSASIGARAAVWCDCARQILGP